VIEIKYTGYRYWAPIVTPEDATFESVFAAISSGKSWSELATARAGQFVNPAHIIAIRESE